MVVICLRLHDFLCYVESAVLMHSLSTADIRRLLRTLFESWFTKSSRETGWSFDSHDSHVRADELSKNDILHYVITSWTTCQCLGTKLISGHMRLQWRQSEVRWMIVPGWHMKIAVKTVWGAVDDCSWLTYEIAVKTVWGAVDDCSWLTYEDCSEDSLRCGGWFDDCSWLTYEDCSEDSLRCGGWLFLVDIWRLQWRQSEVRSMIVPGWHMKIAVKTVWGAVDDCSWLASALCVSTSASTLTVTWQEGCPTNKKLL